MKRVFLLCSLILSSCLNQTIEHKEAESFVINNFHRNLSETIAQLIDETVDGYVLITKSALEYSSIKKAREDLSIPKSIAKFDTDRLHLHAPLSEINEQLYKWGSPLICRKVVADHGDVVEVSTLDVEEPEKLGHGGLGADYLFSLKTFIRKVDLVPVLAVPCKIEFGDKTMIEFDPGVAVGIPWNSDENKRAVSIQQMHFEFSIPDSLLALSYQPRLSELMALEGQMMLDELANLLLNGKKFCPVSEIRLTRLRTPVTHIRNGEKNIIVLVTNGIKLTLQTDRDLVNPYTPNIDRPVLTPKYETPPRWYYRVREGTTVYWDNGRVAGSVRQFFGYQSEVAPGESSWCEIISELFSNEPLCFKLGDIEVIDNKNNR